MLFNQTFLSNLTIWIDAVKYRIFCRTIEHDFPKSLCSQAETQKWKTESLEVFPYSEIQHLGMCTTKGQTVVFDLSTNVTCSKDQHC